MIQGVDVSKYQGEIDWRDVKKSGMDFAIIRTTLRRTDGILATDPKAISNIQGAKNAGIYTGSYHYCRSQNTTQAIEEAKYFLSIIKPYQLEYPVVLDLEDNSIANLGKSSLTEIARVFLETVQDAGYYSMLYCNKYWLTSLLDMESLKAYDVWLAQYPTATYKGSYGMWQYSATGTVKGIPTDVDMNYAYQDYAEIIKKKGLNGFSKTETTQKPEESNPCKCINYPVKDQVIG